MTQPQDKMRAEFDAWCAKDNPRYRHTDDGITSRRDWKIWQAECAQQSAKSQQDARAPLTDARICDIADDYSSTYQHGGNTYDQFDHMGFARAIEAAHGIGKDVP